MAKPPIRTKTTPVATFDPELFAKAIQGLATEFRWSRAVACPCELNDQTGQWDPTCGLCSGDGWLYVNPVDYADPGSGVDYVKVKAVFANAALSPKVTEVFGPFPFGTAMMTVQNEMRVGYRDRFVGLAQEMAWTEVLVRGPADVVSIGRTTRTTAEQRRAMRYEPVRMVLVRDLTTIYRKDQDWRLVDGTDGIRRFEWLPGQGPALGTRYSVHYVVRPVWVVDSATYQVQRLRGPRKGLTGAFVVQELPETFKVSLDYLTPARGD